MANSNLYIHYVVHCITVYKRWACTSYMHCSCTIRFFQTIILVPARIFNILKADICNVVIPIAERNTTKTISTLRVVNTFYSRHNQKLKYPPSRIISRRKANFLWQVFILKMYSIISDANTSNIDCKDQWQPVINMPC